jgi:CubicO group peptidase (beta-lactamase class C family)
VISTASVLACVFLFSCAHPAAVTSETPTPKPPPVAASVVSWPTNGWPTSTPEAQGIDAAVLADALEQIHARHIPIHSLLIERHGKIVLDSYFSPFADDRLHNVYSVTKSVTSMLVGIAMAEHRLDDLDAPVYPILAVQTSNDPRKAQITLANLLSMTSGLDCRGEGRTTLLQEMLRSPHLADYMLNRPIQNDPGKVFDYCGGNSEVVSAVLTRKTGSSALALARNELFTPLGITKVAWPTDSDGVSHGWGDLELQPRDMAKLGYLWLHNGRWENRQIIPAAYLAQALTSHIGVQPGIAYGYGMWLYPGHTPVDFEANGTGGQRITVIPSLDMVEVMTGGGFDANVVQALIASAPRSNSALPANPQAQARLAAIEASLAAPGNTAPAPVFTAEAIPVPRPKPEKDPASVLADLTVPKTALAAVKPPAPVSPQPRVLHSKS